MRHLLPAVWIFFCIDLGLSRAEAAGPAPDLKALLKSADSRVRWKAAETLWRREHSATELVPVYMELLTATDANVRAASAWRLGRWGRDASPAVLMLAAALRDENLEVRVQAGLALANLGDVAEPALPALVRAFADYWLDEDAQAGMVVQHVKKSPALPALVELEEKAFPLLIETLRKSATRGKHDAATGPPPWQAALRAAHVLPVFGRRAEPALLRLLKAKERDSRLHAIIALREMAKAGGLSADAIDQLEGRLDDPDEDVRRAAVTALSWARPSSAKAVAVLAKSKEDNVKFADSQYRDDLERMVRHNEGAFKLLLEALGDKDMDTVRDAYFILSRLDLPAEQALKTWTRALSHADFQVRYGAIRALTRLGRSAKPAKAALRERYAKGTDEHSKREILDALLAIDPDDKALVPLLIKSLDAPEQPVREQARACLITLGAKVKTARAAIEAILLSPKTLSDETYPHEKMRALVVEFARIAPGSARTAATLLKALRKPKIRAVSTYDGDWIMRDGLEDGLLAALPAARPLLREALKDRDVDVRRSAALVLLRAGLETKAALPVLMDGLWDGTDEVGERRRFQKRVVELLSRRQPAVTAEVAAAWCKAWRTAGYEVRRILERGLLVLQPEALPHLLAQLCRARSAESKRRIAYFLARFEGQSKVVLPVLLDELRDPKIASQDRAARVVALLGPDAAEAVPELVKLLNSSDPSIHEYAVEALSAVGRASKPAVPHLKAMLKEDLRRRMMAAHALSRIDPSVSEALVVLRDALIRERNSGAFWVIAGTEPPDHQKVESIYLGPVRESILLFGERAAPVLAEVLDNVDLDAWTPDNPSSQCGAYARVQAALLLAELGPRAKKAVPSLLRALDDRDPYIREAAASALGRIGPAAKEAAPACITLFERQSRRTSNEGTWGPTSAKVPLDFRSLGRSKAHYGPGYGYEYEGVRTDPFAAIRPTYPFDAPHVLSRIDAKECSALPVLAEAAKDLGHPAQLAAALSIWRCGRESPNLVPAFKAALQANPAPFPREVDKCLAELGAELKPAIGAMREWLKRRHWSTPEADLIAVVGALGELGPDAKSAADVLRPMLEGDHREAKRRVAAALALYRILGDRKTTFPVLRDVLQGEEDHGFFFNSPGLSDSARVRATRALGVLAEKGDERARALVAETAKGDENPHVRDAAREALTRIKRTK
jgi:HEAT repeat protein